MFAGNTKRKDKKKNKECSFIWVGFRYLSTNTVQLISNNFACLLCFSIICCKYHHGVSVYLSGEISYPKSVTFFFLSIFGWWPKYYECFNVIHT